MLPLLLHVINQPNQPTKQPTQPTAITDLPPQATTKRSALLEFIQQQSGVATLLDVRRTEGYDAHKAVDALLDSADVRKWMGASDKVCREVLWTRRGMRAGQMEPCGCGWHFWFAAGRLRQSDLSDIFHFDVLCLVCCAVPSNLLALCVVPLSLLCAAAEGAAVQQLFECC